MKKYLLILLSMGLAACTSGLDRKFDGSSEAAFESSLEAIKKSAKPDDVVALDAALMVLALNDVSIGYEGGIVSALQKLSLTKRPHQLADPLMKIVDGKTGREVIAAGKKRKQDEATKQLTATERELMELNRMREENNANKGALAGIEVFDATLRFNSVGPEKMSIMDFKLKNGSATGLSYLYLRGTVSEPVSNKVLHSDDINYKLSDEPLLPGATKAVRLPNSSKGKWNAAEIWGKENLLFRVDVLNAEDLGGKKLTTSFTHKDAARLALLEKNKAELERMLSEK